ncbi:hypothetical protein TW81_09870 [Vibrio galatheae]|uniref:Uncharacterized protein n=1 Tax=Vibrio galatheae TaxID=579748 RepID=A0A0F4NKB2_9VIBR|nr:hypothetical protein [Vibrio galatheae]KJY83294.1 hypothetical protein TW81_09870 [Vibrio galatheae]
MSLQNKKKLADLKSEASELYSTRNAVRQEKLKGAIEAVKSDFTSYLHGEGFECKDNARISTIEASYKDDIFLYLKYDSPEQGYFGCDTVFELGLQDKNRQRVNKKASAVLFMQTERLPHFSGGGTPADMLLKEIAFHEETLLPALKSIGTSDITGEYVLGEREESRGRDFTKKTIPEFIDALMS